jgi:antitoxin component of RelBE/YafQ-DinJ toxin-antitoxin module
LSRKTGRPKSENPKDITIKSRIDAETHKKLMEYCEKHNMTVTDVIRKGVELILEQQ